MRYAEDEFADVKREIHHIPSYPRQLTKTAKRFNFNRVWTMLQDIQFDEWICVSNITKQQADCLFSEVRMRVHRRMGAGIAIQLKRRLQANNRYNVYLCKSRE